MADMSMCEAKLKTALHEFLVCATEDLDEPFFPAWNAITAWQDLTEKWVAEGVAAVDDRWQEWLEHMRAGRSGFVADYPSHAPEPDDDLCPTCGSRMDAQDVLGGTVCKMCRHEDEKVATT